MSLLKRVIELFGRHRLGDWAGALTYYGLLALFPGLIALVSILGVFGDPASTTKTLTEMVTKLGPDAAAKTWEGPITSITAHRQTAGVLLVVGTVLALLGASSYIGAFRRASRVIYDVDPEAEEGEPFWKSKPLELLWTLLMVVLAAVIGLTIVLTGPVVRAIAEPIGVAGTALTVWEIAKWPALVVLVVLLFAVLYYVTAPATGRFRWITAGSALAVGIWLVASALFGLYVANFGSYDKTYGALGGLVILLVWIWITNLALLLGAELNAERER